jgi:hypothetical protein
MQNPRFRLLSQNPWFAGAFEKKRTKPSLGFSLYPPGLPLGAITHLSGQERTQALLQLLAEHPQLKASWVEQSLSAYPPGFAQAGIRLENLLFVQAGDQVAWTLSQLLRSQIFQVVVAASPLKGELELRRLQLAAEKAGSILLCLAGVEGPDWPIKLWLGCSRTREGLRLHTLERQSREHRKAIPA